MKATLELPDELMIEVKVEAARQKKKLNLLVPELLRAGLRAQRIPSPDRQRAAAAWLADWVALGRAATAGLPPGPTATEILEEDRSKLDRR